MLLKNKKTRPPLRDSRDSGALPRTGTQAKNMVLVPHPAFGLLVHTAQLCAVSGARICMFAVRVFTHYTFTQSYSSAEKMQKSPDS